MPQRYGDFATWVGSVGTIAAFAVAFVQIHRERSARKKREFSEWLEAKREHADRVSAWIAGNTVVLSNQSHHLIHDVELEIDGREPIVLDHAEPGRTTLALDGTRASAPVISLAFTDARGGRWVRVAGERPHLAESGSAEPNRTGSGGTVTEN